VKLPDKTDREIISLLQVDGRLAYTDIAKQLELSEGAVRRRVKRLMDSGMLQVVGVVDPQFLGWKAAGMIGVTVRAGAIEKVARQIASFREVSYLFMASGGFDLFVEVICRDMDHFVEFLNEKLQQVPDVERTETFMILKMYKLSYRWGDSEPTNIAHHPRPQFGALSAEE
jgi:Lrp/AsnC family transcriptional regulator for asnA, asnC and gidA